MRANIPQNILVDTGFWFALYDVKDSNHVRAGQIANVIQRSTILIPWPSLYEVLNTKFTKDKIVLGRFETFLEKPSTVRINDTSYRDKALEETLTSPRPISLVDWVIRMMLMDVNLRINYLITFNERDFVDICQRRRIEIIYGD
ncbi:MAG: hypothetical protein HC875_34640 [Anaerolineales bacterium]|nr:hypothetical protein [Anaerolineales bacterium]